MKRKFSYFLFGVILVSAAFSLKTLYDLQPVDKSLRQVISDAQHIQVTDRTGLPLSISYQNRWNTYDHMPLYRIPDFLKRAFLLSEDKRFYQHHGVDWQARLGALKQNITGRSARGASTITEQVVRMLHPRPRNLWSKWLEGFEAASLETQYRKSDILEFYLNQIPYASNRRGIVQATHYYFDRDLTTLSQKEMLALVVLARAPSSYDLYRHPEKIDGAINRLAQQLIVQNMLPAEAAQQIRQEAFHLQPPENTVDASHFISYVRRSQPLLSHSIRTTLDAHVQSRVQYLLDTRLQSLAKKNIHNAAALVADHETGEILAWVVGGNQDADTPANQINAVITPRQPGSALKPFLYAKALEAGWTPATLINDSPLSEAVGNGLHRFKNYSNTFYGPVTLREALANSLNIPALRTISFVGAVDYLTTLHDLGFSSLTQNADVYDEGLALGNGEVTLLELVQGYAALAHRGVYRPLRSTLDGDTGESQRIFSEESASLIANILSDPWARRREFGTGSVLNLPVQTAAKTGTSTDYRDAWAVGFDSRYVVGVWMGNLDQTPTDGVTGIAGPALVLRGVFSELNKNKKTTPLFLSPKLVKKEICLSVIAKESCYPRSEYFMAEHTPDSPAPHISKHRFSLVSPTEGLRLAVDPRIPRELQKFEFKVDGVYEHTPVEWLLNDENITSHETRYLWPLQRGHHRLQARIKSEDGTVTTQKISFYVK
ncbi:MAG: transglycosylase domain-containing protein [Rickettsiales bacterium]